MNSFHNCFPLRTTQFNCKDKHSPHITKALLNSIKEENRLEKLASKWPVTFKEQYRTYRNKLTYLLKAAKNKHYQDQLARNHGNPKSHWKFINNILGRSATIKQSIE